MKDVNAIQFNNVEKKFRKGRKLLLKEALLDVFKPGQTEEFWVLKGVDFEIKKGETFGIIGTNGSGKSTILKLIAGVMVPNKGDVEVEGKVAPLIELGAGFHPELTGRENIYLNGSILGLKKEEVDGKFNDIVEFAELEEFIDTPVKHYSSGMYMRLGFSIAVHTDPEILLVDEILAVGDEQFQGKCFNQMRQFQKNQVTIVLVTHDLDRVGDFCNRIMLVTDGNVKVFDDPRKGVEYFRKTQRTDS